MTRGLSNVGNQQRSPDGTMLQFIGSQFLFLLAAAVAHRGGLATPDFSSDERLTAVRFLQDLQHKYMLLGQMPSDS